MSQLFIQKFATKELGCVQTNATLLTNNSQHCWMLHVASVCTPRCMLLDVVACSCAKFETSQTCQPTTPNISFDPRSPKRNNVGSVCTALPTLLRPHTLITHGLQRLVGCILPAMHCRSQQCWGLKVKNDHRSEFSNLSNWKEEA